MIRLALAVMALLPLAACGGGDDATSLLRKASRPTPGLPRP